jgi:hypothetical protein
MCLLTENISGSIEAAALIGFLTRSTINLVAQQILATSTSPQPPRQHLERVNAPLLGISP